MFVYIDESGSFAHSGDHSYACAGALTIPGRNHKQILDSFEELSRPWRSRGAEIKGSRLNEEHVASVIQLLIAGNAVLHICATDMLYNTPDAIASRRRVQADLLTAHVTPKHSPERIKEVRDIQQTMRSLSDPLFVQMYAMVEVVYKQMQDALIYFALRDPPELGEFRWVLDRKNSSETSYEKLVHTLLPAFIQSRQFSNSPRDRLYTVAEGDYSHFERFCGQLDKWPEHLPRRIGKDPGKQIEIIKVGRIFLDSYILGASIDYPGIQLADIATNAFRRAISGHLQQEGWKDIGRLMFRSGNRSAELIHLGGPKGPPLQLETLAAKTVQEMARVARDPL